MKRAFLKYLRLFGLALFFIGCTETFSPAPKESKALLPAITKEDTHKHYQGKFVWHDLLTDDIASAQAFYSALFGWTFQRQGDYVVILHQDRRIGGMIKIVPKNNKKAEALWLPSLSITDVDKATTYVQKHKGTILKGPMEMEARGKAVLVSDPSGAHIVLLHSKSGDPLDRVPQNGDWLWNELWSNNLQQSYSFYRNLGAYDKVETDTKYLILKRDGKWRAGIRKVKDKKLKVHWVPVIRVADPKTITAKVVTLGGRVLMEPRESFKNGDVAVIVDPSGALVIVQRWEDGGTQ